MGGGEKGGMAKMNSLLHMPYLVLKCVQEVRRGSIVPKNMSTWFMDGTFRKISKPA